MELIDNVSNAAKPRGHYSQAVVHDGLIYVAGQLGINPETQATDVGSIEEQAKHILTSIKAILIAAHSDLNRVLKINVYLSNISDWEAVNKVYADFFGNHKPARIVIPVAGTFHLGFQVAMDVVACQ